MMIFSRKTKNKKNRFFSLSFSVVIRNGRKAVQQRDQEHAERKKLLEQRDKLLASIQETSQAIQALDTQSSALHCELNEIGFLLLSP